MRAELNKYKPPREVKAYYKDLLKDVDGQMKEALSRKDWYNKWGAHYLRSLMHAHLHLQCNNNQPVLVQERIMRDPVTHQG